MYWVSQLVNSGALSVLVMVLIGVLSLFGKNVLGPRCALLIQQRVLAEIKSTLPCVNTSAVAHCLAYVPELAFGFVPPVLKRADNLGHRGSRWAILGRAAVASFRTKRRFAKN